MDWAISREIGVYGNREGSENDSGEVTYFTKTKKGDQIIQSIIEDLIGMRKGDIVFFHVLKTDESAIHGVYRTREEPFFNDRVRIWKSSPSLVYPYRFCFEPYPGHLELCNHDANVPVSEFYQSVENRKIMSILTLEREVRGAAHAVKKITRDDSKEIIRLLYRHHDIYHDDQMLLFKPMHMAMTPLRVFIDKIGKIEFAVKSLLAYELGQKNPNITCFFPPCNESEYDFLIETFVGQTMRRPIDLMCIAEKDTKIVTTIEAKTDKAEIYDLMQSLQYQELFKLRNIDRGSLNYQFSICLLAHRFSPKLAEYASVRNIFLPWEKVILLKYDPIQEGKNAIFTLQKLPLDLPSTLGNYPTLATEAPLEKIRSKVTNFYNIFGKVPVENIVLNLKSSENDYVLLSKRLQNSEKLIGHVLVHQIHGRCSNEKFVKFMKLVRDDVNKSFDGDFMSVEPVLIAEEFENAVTLFIENYNRFETKAQRVPIRAFVQS